MIKDERAVELLVKDLEKIEAELLKRLDRAIKSGQLTKADLAQLSGEIDFFKELNKLGYSSKLEQHFEQYKSIVEEINRQAVNNGLRGLVGGSVGDLDNFLNLKAGELLGRAQLFANELKSGLMGNLIAGTPLKEIIGQLQKSTRLADYQLKVALTTGLKQFRSITTAKVYEDEPEVKYKLYGPEDEKNRPTCAGVLKYQPKEGFTKAEIDAGAWTKLAKKGIQEFGAKAKTDDPETGRVAGELIPSLQRQLEEENYTFLETGGFSCRHEPLAIFGSGKK